MPAKRLTALTGLAVLGALCAGTAASVYTASIPARELYDRSGAHADRLGANPAHPALRGLSPPVAVKHLSYGACLQIREMLFGATDARWNALREVSAKLGADSARARARLAAFDGRTVNGRVEWCRAHS